MNFKVLQHVVFVSFALVLVACDPTSSSLPGKSLGRYSVNGTIPTNTCGSGLGAEDPWDFTADLALDDDTLYLEPTDDSGSGMVYGNVDSDDDTTATLTSTITNNVDADANGNAGPCNLTLSTRYELVLNDASASKSFSGKVTFEFSAATGVSSTTDCTDQLSSRGGKYDTLPCKVEYTLKATRQ